jgi:DnaJ-class molecular chaperone
MMLNAHDEQEEDYTVSTGDICPQCDGSGEGQYDGTTCRHCHGRGTTHYSADSYWDTHEYRPEEEEDE